MSEKWLRTVEVMRCRENTLILAFRLPARHLHDEAEKQVELPHPVIAPALRKQHQHPFSVAPQIAVAAESRCRFDIFVQLLRGLEEILTCIVAFAGDEIRRFRQSFSLQKNGLHGTLLVTDRKR